MSESENTLVLVLTFLDDDDQAVVKSRSSFKIVPLQNEDNKDTTVPQSPKDKTDDPRGVHPYTLSI